MIALSQSRGCKNLRGFPISLNMIFICSECYLKNTLKLGGKRCRRLSVKALKGQRALAEKNGMIETEDHWETLSTISDSSDVRRCFTWFSLILGDSKQSAERERVFHGDHLHIWFLEISCRSSMLKEISSKNGPSRSWVGNEAGQAVLHSEGHRFHPNAGGRWWKGTDEIAARSAWHVFFLVAVDGWWSQIFNIDQHSRNRYCSRWQVETDFFFDVSCSVLPVQMMWLISTLRRVQISSCGWMIWWYCFLTVHPHVFW